MHWNKKVWWETVGVSSSTRAISRLPSSIVWSCRLLRLQKRIRREETWKMCWGAPPWEWFPGNQTSVVETTAQSRLPSSIATDPNVTTRRKEQRRRCYDRVVKTPKREQPAPDDRNVRLKSWRQLWEPKEGGAWKMCLEAPPWEWFRSKPDLSREATAQFRLLLLVLFTTRQKDGTTDRKCDATIERLEITKGVWIVVDAGWGIDGMRRLRRRWREDGKRRWSGGRGEGEQQGMHNEKGSWRQLLRAIFRWRRKARPVWVFNASHNWVRWEFNASSNRQFLSPGRMACCEWEPFVRI